MATSAKRNPPYTTALGKTHGGKWTYFSNNKRWVCNDGKRYVTRTGSLFDEHAPPTFHLYGDGNPRIIPGPIHITAPFETA